MKLIISEDKPVELTDFTVEELTSPNFNSEFLLLVEKYPNLKEEYLTYRQAGVCATCAAGGVKGTIEGNTELNVDAVFNCDKRKPCGLEPWGVLSIDWTQPHGPICKKCVVIVHPFMFRMQPEDLVWMVDNMCYHSRGKYGEINKLFRAKCPLGGSVKRRYDCNPSILEVTIHID